MMKRRDLEAVLETQRLAGIIYDYAVFEKTHEFEFGVQSARFGEMIYTRISKNGQVFDVKTAKYLEEKHGG
jgi:hypothetical protein